MSYQNVINVENISINRTIVDRIYQKLKEDILVNNKFELGQRLFIKGIENDFHVSQTPVREVLNRLVKDNIIIYKPRKGYYIIELFFKDMKEIYKLREHFECIALEVLCSKKNNQVIEKLDHLCDKISTSIKNKNIDRQRIYNLQFHQLIINSTENIRLIRFYNELREHLKLLDTLTDKFHQDPSYSNQEHREILRFLKDFNTSLAVNKMRKHISSVIANIQIRAEKYYHTPNFDNIKVSNIAKISDSD